MGNTSFGVVPQKHIACEYLAFNRPAIWWKHHPCIWYPEFLLSKQEKLKCQRQWHTREEHVELPKLFIGLKQLSKIYIFHCKIWQDEQNKFVPHTLQPKLPDCRRKCSPPGTGDFGWWQSTNGSVPSGHTRKDFHHWDWDFTIGIGFWLGNQKMWIWLLSG